MNHRHILLWAFSALLFWGCQKDHAGGAPGETTNGIALRVMDSQGVALRHAKAYLYEAHTLIKRDSLLTDSLGEAVFQVVDSGQFGVEVIYQDSSFMAWRTNIVPSDTQKTTLLAKPSRALVVRNVPSTSCELVGTPYQSSSVEGQCVFVRVPEGNWLLQTSLDLDPQSVKTESDTIEWSPDANGILLENFDDGDLRPLLGVYWPSSTWNWWVGVKEFTFNRTTTGAYQGRSLYLPYTEPQDTVLPQPIQWFGFRLGHSSDWSSLDSISLWVRGNGKIGVALETIRNPEDSLLLPDLDPFQKVVWSVNASTDWTRVVLPMSQSKDLLLSTTDWVVIQKRIDQFTLFTYGGDGIWVDEIRLYGLGVETLIE